MNYIEKRREALADWDREMLVDHVINEELNDLVGRHADYEKDETDPNGHGKRVPYVGWYWRSVDFAGGYFTIGHCGDFIGFMENNKWGYAQRRLTPEESAQVIEIVCEAMRLNRQGGSLAEIIENTQAKLAELWSLLQTFPMHVDGFWIWGPQGQVGFADNLEDADKLIAALSEAGGGIPYSKVSAAAQEG